MNVAGEVFHTNRKWLEAWGTALFVMLLLFAGVGGAVSVYQTRTDDALVQRQIRTETAEAMDVAFAYYAKKYHDSNVSVEIRPVGDHMQAEIRKEGSLVKKLSIKGKIVKEQPIGVRAWVFDLLTNLG
jgi:hypothetical protein